MTVAARALRLDAATWRRIEAMATPAGAGLMVLSSYLMFALDRLGVQGLFQVRSTIRIVLTGFYGWMWLVGATWLIARLAYGWAGSAALLAPLIGHAHLPLLLVAVFIQFVSVALNLSGFAFWPGLLAVGFWMPAMLISATAAATGISLSRATLAAGVPFLIWALVVGRSLWTQIGHLL